jgi:DNA-binding NarL/FixJ family response regulator
MRVVIADDHWTVRDGLRWMLADYADIEVVGEAADGRELLELLEAVPADVVLLDVNMPEMTGLEALELIKEVAPDTRVIVLSMYDKAVYVKRAIELGADGYLLKSAGRDEVIRALTTVAEGRPYIQGEITGPLIQQLAGGEELPAGSKLSPRERQVLELVSKGMENKQVARELDISEATVKSYLQSAFERLGVRSRAEAVAVALREGLIE